MMSTLEFLQTKLAYELDVLATAEGLAEKRFVLVDTRKKASWDAGHVPGALHLPSDQLDGDLSDRLPEGTKVVVYGWGPGCNGGTQTALKLAQRGYSVQEMIGGLEYWRRTGLPVEELSGIVRQTPDPLVTADSSHG